MAFLKANKSAVSRKNTDGIVYILEMVVDGIDVVKIGVTGRANVDDRCLEILTSYKSQYRHFCYLKPKRYRKTSDIYEKEKVLHNYFKECSYTPEKRFGGSSEIFLIGDKEHLLDMYVKVLEGYIPEDAYVPKS